MQMLLLFSHKLRIEYVLYYMYYKMSRCTKISRLVTLEYMLELNNHIKMKHNYQEVDTNEYSRKEDKETWWKFVKIFSVVIFLSKQVKVLRMKKLNYRNSFKQKLDIK